MYLTQGLQRMLQQDPDHVATIFRGRTRTFREQGERVSRLAAALQALGMRSGDRVGMLALNSDRYLEYMLATWWGGGVLNPVNIRWSVPEIVYSLDDCQTEILLIDDHFLHLAEGIRAGAKCAPLLVHVGDGEAPEGMHSFEDLIARHEPVADAMRGGNDLASIMYTGGTTGLPKGVMQSHMNLWSSAVARLAEFPTEENSRTLHAAPMFHTAAMARCLSQVISGDVNVFIPMFDALEVIQTIERERINEMLLVPTMLQAVINHPDFERHDLSCLKRMAYGASPISLPVLEQALAKLPGVAFMQAYGMTESSPVISISPEWTHEAEGIASGLVRSAGRGGYGGLVKVVDEDGNEVPRGTVGEVIVCGPNVMLGYWNRPEETARTLRNGWLHTGDGAYMDERGFLFIVDRLKDMIVTGGENVYSAEVENVVARHPAVQSCAVIGIPHERWGEAVHAVVVLREGSDVCADDIRAHCTQHIAGYKCPKTVEFVTALPLSAAGKVLKRDLRAPYWKDQKRAVN